ncbi:MAG TPA: TetR family transcriptional regulator [Longimicrobiaceae bacterium]|nr:TetR family transcriptional regulator [Longimicrobiaceae bacterium]
MSEIETSDTILAAAEELFARQGFAATTTKQIGTAAGVNPALIHYYFGNKEGLYRALLRRLFETIIAKGARQLASSPAPDAAVRALVGIQSETMVTHPSFPRLLARELVDHGMTHAGEYVARLSDTLFRRLCELIRGGQEAGIFRRDMDPRFAAVSVVSLVPYFHIARPVVGILLDSGPDGPDEEAMRAYGRHAAEFALAALAARSDAQTTTDTRESGR